MNIPNEKIVKVFEDNIEEILKDVLTGYDSPVKKVLEEEEFVNELKEIARNTLRAVMTDEEFKKALKNRILEKVAENILR